MLFPFIKNLVLKRNVFQCTNTATFCFLLSAVCEHYSLLYFTILHFETVIFHLGSCNLERCKNSGLSDCFPYLREYLVAFSVLHPFMSRKLFNKVSRSVELF